MAVNPLTPPAAPLVNQQPGPKVETNTPPVAGNQPPASVRSAPKDTVTISAAAAALKAAQEASPAKAGEMVAETSKDAENSARLTAGQLQQAAVEAGQKTASEKVQDAQSTSRISRMI